MSPDGFFFIFGDINVDWLPHILCNECICYVSAGLGESSEVPEFSLENKSCCFIFLNPFKTIFVSLLLTIQKLYSKWHNSIKLLSQPLCVHRLCCLPQSPSTLLSIGQYIFHNLVYEYVTDNKNHTITESFKLKKT